MQRVAVQVREREFTSSEARIAREHKLSAEDDVSHKAGRGRPRPEADLGSARRQVSQAAADRPAPEGGTADSASAKVPSAAWPRGAPERHQRRQSNAAGLARHCRRQRVAIMVM